MNIKLINQRTMVFALLLIVVIGLFFWRSLEMRRSKAITQVSEQTNQALFQLIALHEQLKSAEWDNEEYRKKILQSFESFNYETNEAYNIANKNKGSLPDDIYRTVDRLKMADEYIWNANESSLRELDRQDIKTRERTILNFTEMIMAANFKFFNTDSSSDSWYLLNKELVRFITVNMVNSQPVRPETD